MKKLLLTGGNGFLGKHLAKRLVNYDVTIPGYDLRKLEHCQSVTVGQNIVIHLAGNVGGIGYNQQNPGRLFYDNAIMGIQLMEAARQNGVEKFVTIGTVCAYPKYVPAPFCEENLWCGYPEETNAPYGLAKKMLLVQGQAYRQQYGFNAIYLLPTNLYGPGDNFDPDSSHVIPALISKIHDANQTVEVWGSGQATREFLYVEDAAEGILLALENYDQPEPVNLGGHSSVSISRLIELLVELMDFKGKVVWNLNKPDGQPVRSLDKSRALEFGFSAKTDFRQGLKETLKWYAEFLHFV